MKNKSVFNGGAYQDKTLMSIMDRLEFNEEDQKYLKLKKVVRILSSRGGKGLEEVFVNEELTVPILPRKEKRIFLSFTGGKLSIIPSVRDRHNAGIIVDMNDNPKGEKDENYDRGIGEDFFKGNLRGRVWR